MMLPEKLWLTQTLPFLLLQMKIPSCYLCADKEQMHTVKYSLLNCGFDWLITFSALIEDQGCNCRFQNTAGSFLLL